jgi:hypothetical protein
MPLGWWLRAAVSPLVIAAILLGLGRLRYSMAAPSTQVPTSVRGTITGFRLGAHGSAVELSMQASVALQDGTETVIALASDDATTCRVGDMIALDRYVDHRGGSFFRAASHPCDSSPARRASPRK